MSLDTVCYALAVPGAILTWLGRRMILGEAASISTGWAWAIRMLPLADLMFLARFWDLAKGGAFVSIAGLVCLLPMGGKMLWEESDKTTDFTAQARALEGDAKGEIYASIKREHQERIEAKQRKLQQLHGHMAAWYASMNERRTRLNQATAGQLASFNTEAAAYQSLHKVTKAEAAELQTMLNRKLDAPNDIPVEDYAAYLSGTERRARARFTLDESALSEESDESDE